MKPYGGYLPLELNNGTEYYTTNEHMRVIGLNSGKASIYYVLKAMNVEKIYIPYYICPSVITIVQKTDTKIERYYIDENFLPVNVNIQNDKEFLLFVNYFGIMHDKIPDIVRKYHNLIIDNTQAFFEPPVLADKVYNIYSCKKFIGVPDGGYLIAKEILQLDLEKDHSSKHMDFCIQSLEYGTDYAYQSKKKNDLRFLNDFCYMSQITRKILMNANYNNIQKRRKENFYQLHDRLRKYNKLDLSNIDFVPYYYPLLLEKQILSELLEQKIYAPVLWKELISPQFIGKVEYNFSQNIAFLPLDQRYTKEDMKEMVNRVMEILESNI